MARLPMFIHLNTILSRYREYEGALTGLDHQVCFAVKANSTLAILHALAQEGAGFDIVSGGELHRVLSAGGDPSKVVFSGVGKSSAEIRFALEKGIYSFNCESKQEIALISEIAVALHRRASMALRVNPDVDAVTHPYISTGLKEHKFGVDINEAEAIYARASILPLHRVAGRELPHRFAIAGCRAAARSRGQNPATGHAAEASGTSHTAFRFRRRAGCRLSPRRCSHAGKPLNRQSAAAARRPGFEVGTGTRPLHRGRSRRTADTRSACQRKR